MDWMLWSMGAMFLILGLAIERRDTRSSTLNGVRESLYPYTGFIYGIAIILFFLSLIIPYL